MAPGSGRTVSVPWAIASLVLLSSSCLTFSVGQLSGLAPIPPPPPGFPHGAPLAELPAAAPRPAALGAPAPGTPELPIRIGSFDPAVPRPTGWTPGTAPPGAPVLGGSFGTGERPGRLSLGLINTTWNNSVCSGLWPQSWGPGGGQGLYAPGCYGHDEPAIQFFSPLIGSGGNVTWSVTLPIDRSPTLTQSDLYVAVWFGLTLSDPYSWLHQCFLELQLYPDSTYGSGSGYDNWVGAAVAWQIEASNGYENPCYYAPLGLDGGAPGTYLNMAGGDALSVRMNGWAGDPYGESVSVADLTTGASSTLTLYNATAGPLDPAYSTSGYDNSLLWTPGGEFPVSFAFETGHSGSGSFPENNSYGGCSPGVPPPTAQDGAVPCPSYDPGSWTNDTLSPWKISAPVFSNQTASMRPSQVGFGQPEGGHLLIDSVSNGSCDGQDGSAWCSYPWYSFSCANRAFEFGATDYPGTTTDFGAFLQFGSTAESDGLGLGYFPPTNFSIPTCGAPSYTLGVSAGAHGSVDLLSTPYPPNGTRTGLGAGWYSIRALAEPGNDFLGWTVSGNLSLGTVASDPLASLDLLGDGSIAARFGPPRAGVDVSFTVSGGFSAAAAVVAAIQGPGAPSRATHLANGSVTLWAPGEYELQALPPVGSRFVAWAAGPGLSIASTTSPYTEITVTGSANGTSLRASFSAFRAWATVDYTVWPSLGGSVLLNGSSTTSSASQTLETGTWEIIATPGPGFVFAYWYVGGNAETEEPQATTNLTLEGATVYVYAYFAHAIHLDVAPVGAGLVQLVYSGTYTDNQTADLYYNTYYPFASEPAPGFSFLSWSSSNGSAAWVLSPDSPATYVEINASATVTVTYVSNEPVNLTLDDRPASAGAISFNGGGWVPSGTVNRTLAAGTYLVGEVANPGYVFSTWTTTGPVALSSGPAGTTVVVSGAGGSLTAVFQPVAVLVTFSSYAAIGVQAMINGTSLSEDATIPLEPGTYAISLTLSDPNDALEAWMGTPGLSVSGGNLTVSGPGTIYALIAPFGPTTPTATPSKVPFNTTFELAESVQGSGPFIYEWRALPGCAGTAARFACRASVSGTFPISVVVLDSYGDAATSPTIVVSVDVSSLQGFAVADPNATDVGVPVTISVTTENGLGPFSYRYALPSGCVDQDRSVLNCTPTAPGSGASVVVSDALGLATVFPIALTVNPLPNLTISDPRPWTVDRQSATQLSVGLSGGTAPFSFSWSGLPAGCPVANGATLTCAPAVQGRFTVTVTVRDAVGGTARVTSDLVVVPDPSVLFAPAPPAAVDRGALFPLGVAILGGLAPFSAIALGLAGGCHALNQTQWTCVPAAEGTSTISIWVTDSDGRTAWANTSLRVTPDPMVSMLLLAPVALPIGSTLTIEANVTGGSGNLSFRYLGLPPGCPSFDGPSGSCVPSGAGTFGVEVKATDSSGLSATGFANVTVTSPSGVSTLEVVLIGLGLAAVVGGVITVYLRNRRGRRGAAVEPGVPRTEGPSSD